MTKLHFDESGRYTVALNTNSVKTLVTTKKIKTH